MKTRKNILALLLAASCAFAFTACGGSNEQVSSEPEQKTEVSEAAVTEETEDATEETGDGLSYKAPGVEASEWEAKSLDDLAAIDLTTETIAYQLSGTSINAQGKAFGLIMNLYEDGLVVTTQYTKGSPATITYYGYWENTEDPSIDVTQFGCILTNMPESMASLNNTQWTRVSY